MAFPVAPGVRAAPKVDILLLRVWFPVHPLEPLKCKEHLANVPFGLPAQDTALRYHGSVVTEGAVYQPVPGIASFSITFVV